MLCHLCETFLSDLLSQDFVNWRRVDSGWYTCKHGDYGTVRAAAEAGCVVCALFNRVRGKHTPGYEDLNQKWLAKASSIDYRYEMDRREAAAVSNDGQPEDREKWSFSLLTLLPEMSILEFELYNPSLPTEPKSSPDTRPSLPHTVSPVANARAAVDIASTWLGDCIGSHSHCSRQARPHLPTRVLDIRPAGDSFNLRLQVNKGHQGQYVTLSHCWGSQGRLVLNKRNLAAFQRDLPFEQLPPTFVDAIRLTASLGQRYLWIDALCILQDDQEDWRREAASMCSVFENALFSISALSAQDSHSGLLQERKAAQAIVSVAGLEIGVRERLPSLEEALQGSKLETRAWCLQERLLSPRILHIAPGQLHWECRTYMMSETTPSDTAKNDSGDASRPFIAFTRKRLALGKTDHDHHRHWLSLVAGYSDRNLTKPSDRLPAISGLAEKAKKELGLGTYMHGLWLDNLLAGLLWRRRPRRRSDSIARTDDFPPTPTWSWASLANAIEYPLLDGHFENPSVRADLVLKERHPDDTREVYGSAADALSIIGRIRRVYCKVDASSSTHEEALFKPSGSLLTDNGLSCTLDGIDEPMSRGCYCLFVGAFGRPTRQTARGEPQHISCYLVLERVQDDDAPHFTSGNHFGSFRRIGMGYDLPRKVDFVFANAERRRLDLV